MKPFQQIANERGRNVASEIKKMVACLHMEDEKERERALEMICEAPISVTTTKQYEILLATGGPASRIVGELQGSYPETAALEYQDRFEPWTRCELSAEEEAALLEYARQFYFE